MHLNRTKPPQQQNLLPAESSTSRKARLEDISSTEERAEFTNYLKCLETQLNILNFARKPSVGTMNIEHMCSHQQFSHPSECRNQLEGF